MDERDLGRTYGENTEWQQQYVMGTGVKVVECPGTT
jgi:hypothetical protein